MHSDNNPIHLDRLRHALRCLLTAPEGCSAGSSLVPCLIERLELMSLCIVSVHRAITGIAAFGGRWCVNGERIRGVQVAMSVAKGFAPGLTINHGGQYGGLHLVVLGKDRPRLVFDPGQDVQGLLLGHGYLFTA